MSVTLLLLLVLVGLPLGIPPTGTASQTVPDYALQDRFEGVLEGFTSARETLIRAGVDDTPARVAWLPVLLELADEGSGRAAALFLRHRLPKTDPAVLLARYGQIERVDAGATWIVDPELDVLGSLRRDAGWIGRDEASFFASRFRDSAPDDAQRLLAELLVAQIEEDGAADEPARKRKALALHRRIVEDHPGTPAAEEAADALWRLKKLQVGSEAPNFVTRDVDGNQIRLSQYTAMVTVVDFWSFADPGAAARLAQRAQLYERHREERFVLQGINLDANEIEFRRGVERHGIEWSNAFEGGSGRNAVWKVHRGPRNFVIDALGVIRFVDLDGEELDDAVSQLLREGSRRGQGGSAGAEERAR